MRNFLLALVVLIAGAFRPDDPPKPAVPKQDPVKVYFGSMGLNVDSAATPYLYYQVHDWIGTRYQYAGPTKK
ncbi:MAG: hypothetical protein ACRC3B_14020, partial [Bacteroidia bacterium]